MPIVISQRAGGTTIQFDRGKWSGSASYVITDSAGAKLTAAGILADATVVAKLFPTEYGGSGGAMASSRTSGMAMGCSRHWTLDVPVAWKRPCSLGGGWALALRNTLRNWMLAVLALRKRMFWASSSPWGRSWASPWRRSRQAQALAIGSGSGGAGGWTLDSKEKC